LPKYPAILAAATALSVFALPAAAQVAPVDDRYAGVAELQDDGWEGEAQAGASYAAGEEVTFEPVDVDAEIGPVSDEGSDAPIALDYAPVSPDGYGRASAPVLGYSAAERDDWLSQCRALRPGPRRRYSAEGGDIAYAGEGNSFDYCEAYLTNYERGYGVPAQGARPAAQTAPIAPPAARPLITRVVEEEVEADSE